MSAMPWHDLTTGMKAHFKLCYNKPYVEVLGAAQLKILLYVFYNSRVYICVQQYRLYSCAHQHSTLLLKRLIGKIFDLRTGILHIAREP